MGQENAVCLSKMKHYHTKHYHYDFFFLVVRSGSFSRLNDQFLKKRHHPTLFVTHSFNTFLTFLRLNAFQSLAGQRVAPPLSRTHTHTHYTLSLHFHSVLPEYNRGGLRPQLGPGVVAQRGPRSPIQQGRTETTIRPWRCRPERPQISCDLPHRRFLRHFILVHF